MDLVKELMTAFEESGINKMKIEMEGIKLELEKGEPQIIQAAVPMMQAAPIQPALPQAAPVAQSKAEKEPTGTPVKSPLVGTYYDSPSPEAQPFVKAGDHVTKGQTLCIIEAMKVMNEIKAPVDGTIKEILVKSEDLVEYDQTLMLIEEA
jgi:acetyl-CoA carboxylase biotin carboxyl carrier protein